MENNVKNEFNKSNVIVIGAGIAGLSSAYHLCKNGVSNIKILEARKRIGGRIIDLYMGNQKVALGAKWIHGVLGNPIYEFAMTHGLVDIMQPPKPHKMIAATESGKQVSFHVLQEVCEAYLCFLQRCEEYFISQYSPPEGIDSVGDHIKLEINLYLDKIQNSSERHQRKLIFDCLLKRETCISGCDDMSEVDLLELGSYTELQGGNVTLPNGYSSILEPLTKILPPDSLLFQHPVTKIRWNCGTKHSETGNESDDSDQTVVAEHTYSQKSSRESSCEKGISNVEVLCENGNKFYADHVICTVPLGVLKENVNTLFEPPLPNYKLEAIDHLLFGTVDKIILEYDRPFLNPDITEILLLWEGDKKQTHDQSDLKDRWYKKIYSFSKLSETLLLGWISGKEAEYMELLPTEDVVDTCTEILRKFLNDPFVPKPKNCVW